VLHGFIPSEHEIPASASGTGAAHHAAHFGVQEDGTAVPYRSHLLQLVVM